MMLEELGRFYFQQGLRYVKDKRITLAVTVLEKAAVLRESDWKIRNVLGLCYYRLGDFSKSKEVWEQSLFQSPEENPAARYLEDLQREDFFTLSQKYNKALELARSGKYKQAEQLLRQKELLCFSFVSFTNLLGLCLYGRGKKQKALRVWLRALSLDRENPFTLKYLLDDFTKTKTNRGLGRCFQGFFNRKA
jgi:tetratricopeptide (TPR) repeat protein